jgi:NDP-sugar pyrophosphorylase family protein
VQNLSHITTAILAGGFGTRLRSALADRPKGLAEIRGRPFLAYLLDQLASAGVRYVVLCTGYLGEQVHSCFGDSYESLHLVYSQELSPLGTAGALRLAMPLFKSDPVLVMNGDSFCKADLRAFATWHSEHRSDATLLLTEVSDTGRYGRVNVDNEGLIHSFYEKGDKSGPGWINAGVYLLSLRLLLTISESRPVSLEREIFPDWVGRGLYGYRNLGDFLDIGTPETYAEADRFFAPED